MAESYNAQLFEARREDAEQYASVKHDFDLEGVQQRFEWMQTVNVTWYVWYEDGEPVGWALISWDGKSTEPDYPDLFDLYVRADRRSQGIGTSIVRACEEIVRARGYTKLGLAANPDHNERAHRLYNRLGYTETGIEPYLDGVYNGVEDWVIDLAKTL